MAISGDLTVSATLCAHSSRPIRSSFLASKVEFTGFQTGGAGSSDVANKWPGLALESSDVRRKSLQTCCALGSNKLSSKAISQEAESFLLNTINMPFLERLNLAWKIMFPSPAARRSSNAHIAKQRLKMILFSDRCAVSDEAKRRIVKNIVKTLSDFVEIESQEKVQLSVTSDSDVGTVYSVTVPVRRVKPEYQEIEEIGSIMNVDYKDNGETSGSVDVTFDFYVPE
uniref:Plastid division regulator MinE n=1 Tax=Kalanchoe fedtschenkoi TaxID=63787 RepID=A0A7N1A314_KALFE